MVVVLCDARGRLGFFAGSINNLLRLAYPTARGVVGPRMKSVVSRHNVDYIMRGGASRRPLREDNSVLSK